MIKRILVTILGLLAVTAAGLRAANSDQQQTNPWTVGTWAPPTGLTQVPIWPSRAPDMTGAPEAAETISKYGGVTNVTSPTITIFPPKGENAGDRKSTRLNSSH